MKNEFLHKEYELSYSQLRYYDEKQTNILKFVFTLSSTIVTALFAILKIIGAPTNQYFLFQSLISFILFIAISLQYLSLVRNRLYFVFIARQLNSLRNYLLENEGAEFKNQNQLWTSTDFSAAKWSSSHLLQMIGVSIISSLFASISIFSMYKYFYIEKFWWVVGLCFMIIFAIEVFGGYFYLRIKSSKRADDAVH